MDKTKNPVILSIIHHRQNLLESTYPQFISLNIVKREVTQMYGVNSEYSQTSVHELNSFLKVVRKPKLFSP
jgi:hypothetical protein